MQKLSLFDPTRTIRFVTGSSYEGDFNPMTLSMEGFGCYTFPNGNVYRGYFRGGKFHGSGLMKAGSPYNFIVYGKFEDGHLKQIDTMIFNDGLRAYGELKDGTLDLSSWKYCRPADRRFLKEIKEGLKPVGMSPAAATEKDNSLKPGSFDAEEGIFNAKNGFLSERPLPFKATEFVGCLKKSHWIRRNCREGRELDEAVEPTEQFCRSILENNIQNLKWTDANYGDLCAAGQKEGYKYFSKLYEMELKSAAMTMGADELFEANSAVDEELKSSSSFSDVTPRNDILMERVREKPKLVCECEGSLSIDMDAMKMRKVLYG